MEPVGPVYAKKQLRSTCRYPNISRFLLVESLHQCCWLNFSWNLDLRYMIHDFNYMSIRVVILFPRILGANRLLLQPKSTKMAKMVAHLSGNAFTSTVPPALISQAGAQSASSGIFEAWESRDLKGLAPM